MNFDWADKYQDWAVRIIVILLVLSVSSMILLVALNILGLTSVDILNPKNLVASFLLMTTLGGFKICVDRCT